MRARDMRGTNWRRFRPACASALGLALVLAFATGCGEVKVATVDPTSTEDAAAGDVATTDDSNVGVDSVGVDSVTGDVIGDECITDFDCVGVVEGTTPCRLAACASGFCGLKDRPAATPC